MQLLANIMDDLKDELQETATMAKRGMKERFGRHKVKRDGELSKIVQIAPMHILHTDEEFKYEWIDYSALDAKVSPGCSCCWGCMRVRC